MRLVAEHDRADLRWPAAGRRGDASAKICSSHSKLIVARRSRGRGPGCLRDSGVANRGFWRRVCRSHNVAAPDSVSGGDPVRVVRWSPNVCGLASRDGGGVAPVTGRRDRGSGRHLLEREESSAGADPHPISFCGGGYGDRMPSDVRNDGEAETRRNRPPKPWLPSRRP